MKKPKINLDLTQTRVVTEGNTPLGQNSNKLFESYAKLKSNNGNIQQQQFHLGNQNKQIDNSKLQSKLNTSYQQQKGYKDICESQRESKQQIKKDRERETLSKSPSTKVMPNLKLDKEEPVSNQMQKLLNQIVGKSNYSKTPNSNQMNISDNLIKKKDSRDNSPQRDAYYQNSQNINKAIQQQQQYQQQQQQYNKQRMDLQNINPPKLFQEDDQYDITPKNSQQNMAQYLPTRQQQSKTPTKKRDDSNQKLQYEQNKKSFEQLINDIKNRPLTPDTFMNNQQQHNQRQDNNIEQQFSQTHRNLQQNQYDLTSRRNSPAQINQEIYDELKKKYSVQNILQRNDRKAINVQSREVASSNPIRGGKRGSSPKSRPDEQKIVFPEENQQTFNPLNYQNSNNSVNSSIVGNKKAGVDVTQSTAIQKAIQEKSKPPLQQNYVSQSNLYQQQLQQLQVQQQAQLPPQSQITSKGNKNYQGQRPSTPQREQPKRKGTDVLKDEETKSTKSNETNSVYSNQLTPNTEKAGAKEKKISQQTHTTHSSQTQEDKLDEFSDSSTSSTVNYTEEMVKNQFINGYLESLISIEQNLFILTYKRDYADIVNNCKSYLKTISQECNQDVENALLKKSQKNTLPKMLLLERIIVIMTFYEAIRQQRQEEDYLLNISNALIYVHGNSLIWIDYLLEKYNSVDNKQWKIIEQQALSLIQERQKIKRFPSIKNKQQRVNVINNNNEIVQPIIKLIVHDKTEDPYVTIKSLIENIDNISINQATKCILEIQSEIIDQLEQTVIIQDKLDQQNLIDKQEVDDNDEEDDSTIQNKQYQEQAQKQNEKLMQQQQQAQQLQQQQQTKQKQQNQTTQQPQPTQKSQQQTDKSSQQKQNDTSITDKKQLQDEIQAQQQKIQQELEQQKQKQELNDSNKQNNKQEDQNQQQDDIVGTVQPPYLPQLSDDQKDSKYTLVLDLDETLVHYQELEDGGQFLVRPYAENFIEEISKYYEVVVFTAALQDYADFILDIIDQKHCITAKLYRQHTVRNGQTYAKDLSKIGRDMSKIMIIDNIPENFAFQPENGIYIQSWFGEPEDRALFDLTPLLKQIVQKKFPDVRIALRRFRDKMMENISKGVQDPHLNLNLDED